ncbi:YbaB/EbfC family nucleoid-associated protein [Amycolatopsis samaneae]|uniref:YbaB/EbfC family nucleoid-associated protein n=1 Tax=Amycolatopsis samaneae TaxID=664691 RepID=A0ABW5GA77_9PSEU
MSSEDMLYHLAKEIDARVAAVENAATAGEALPLVTDIGAGLGAVTVDGSGTLVSIDLDRDAMATQTGASLAGHVLRAVNRAETAASRRREAMIAEAAKEGDFR